MAAPFEAAYEEHYKLREAASKYTSEEAPQGVREGGEVMAIRHREEEAIYIKASHDRVTVIFSTIFREETDRIFGKVFIQEFVDARRRAIQNAPQVLFRNDPPLELQQVPGIQSSSSGEIGFVTFGSFGFLDSSRRCLRASPLGRVTDETAFSSLSPSPYTAADARGDFSHPDLPRLLPLPHQGIKGLYSFAHAEEDGGLSARQDSIFPDYIL